MILEKGELKDMIDIKCKLGFIIIWGRE